MKKNKICVYCICKNESKFVNRFMNAIEEVKDHVYVLDTGSTDDTVELFKKRNVHIEQKSYEHFTFNEARNDSLNLVPKDYDICISLDLDDVIQKGFIDTIDKLWEDGTTQLDYPYYYTLDENDNPVVQQRIAKIHARNGFYWEYPIHEVLRYSGEHPKVIYTDEILVIHRPDVNKSREFYLDLLEERVKNVPNDTRNLYLLAREYNSRLKWFDSITMCHRYLEADKCSFVPELMKVKCLLSRTYRFLKMYEEAELWANKAIEEYSLSREPYLEKTIIYYDTKRYEQAVQSGKKALEIEKYNTEVIDEAGCWDGSIYDYVSLAYYYMHDYDNAIKYVDMTIAQNPEIQRLKDNRALFVRAKENAK